MSLSTRGGPAWEEQTGLVTLPSGAVVRGRRVVRPAGPADFSLLLSGGPAPPWSSRRVRWPDFWVPLDRVDALDALAEALRRAHDGERVEIACRGGVGRTGTALAALAVLDGLPAEEAVAWVRAAYHPRSVETPWQRRWLHTLPGQRGRLGPGQRGPARLAASPAGVWTVKHVVAPVQRWVMERTAGRVTLAGGAPLLLLTTVGRRTGRPRTVPLFYVRDGASYLVCNVRPAGERANPWPGNLDAHPTATVRVRGRRLQCTATRLPEREIELHWARLLDVWPAYAAHYAHTGDRSVFRLTPTGTDSPPARRPS